jgi:hypothetical protein
MTVQRRTPDPGRSSGPMSRLQRLQVLLLVVVGLWSIESGVGPGEAESVSHALPAVASGALHAAEASSEPAVARETLAGLLGDVNPHLDSSELKRIASAVIRYSSKYRLDPDLVTAVLLVESTARPWVRSPMGAVGLMQVMPHMMQPMGLAGNAATIESNVEAGCWILASNILRLGEEQGISSYFWGSDIRGSAYLRRVQVARAEVRRQLAS